MSCFKSTCPCESRGCRHRPKTVRLRVRHASPHLMMMMMLVMVMVMVMLMRVEIFLIYSFLLFATFRHHNTNHRKKDTLHTQRCATSTPSPYSSTTNNTSPWQLVCSPVLATTTQQSVNHLDEWNSKFWIIIHHLQLRHSIAGKMLLLSVLWWLWRWQ